MTRTKFTEWIMGKAAEDGVELEDLDATLSGAAASSTPPDQVAVNAEVAALKAQNEQLQTQFARLAEERRQAQAQETAQRLLSEHRIPPAAVEDLVPLLTRIAASEESGALAAGEQSAVDLFSAFAAKLPDLSIFTTNAVADQAAMALPNATQTTGSDELSEETINALLATSPLGRSVLADRNGKGA